VRRLDVEPFADERPDHGPLIQAQTVHHHEHGTTMHIENRPQKLRADVDGQRWPVGVTPMQPAGVVPLQIAGEVLPHAVLQCAQCVLQARLIRLAEPDLPLGELDHDLDPFAPCQRTTPTSFELAKAGGEVPREPLLPYAIALEKTGDHREDLARVHRLDQVIRDFGTDRVLERLRFLALGNHHDRHAVVYGSDRLEDFKAASTRHLLVQQNDTIRLALEEHQGIVTMGSGLHGKTLLL
jgi:hypothetical protein